MNNISWQAVQLSQLAENPPLKEIDNAVKQVLGGAICCTGIGKSGLLAQKLASTLNAHGVSAYFLHPVEALHGDLGRIAYQDPVIAVSHSGKTRELRALLESQVQWFDVGFYGSPHCVLSQDTHAVIPSMTGIAIDEHTNFVPSASFTVTSVLIDEFALRVANAKRTKGLESTHPGGTIGELVRGDGGSPRLDDIREGTIPRDGSVIRSDPQGSPEAG